MAASNLHPSVPGKDEQAPLSPPPRCAASLLHQSGLVCMVTAASTLHPSAAGKDVEQPQACSISRSVMAVRLQTTFHAGVLGRGSKHSPSECRRQRTSTHLESASASHLGQPHACSITRSVIMSPSQQHIAGVGGRGGNHSPPECRKQRLEAAASLLHQSERHGGSIANHNLCRCAWPEASTLHPSAAGRERAVTVWHGVGTETHSYA